MMDFNLTLDDDPSPSQQSSSGVNYLVSSQVDDVDDELRFVWVQKLTRDCPGSGEEHGDSDDINGKGGSSRPGAHTGNFSKQGRHQENFSATKYIKP